MSWIKAKDGLICLETGAKIYWVKGQEGEKNLIFHEIRGCKMVLCRFSDMKEKDEIFKKIRTILEVQNPLSMF